MIRPSFRGLCVSAFSASLRLRAVDQDQFQTVFKKIDRTMKITGVSVDGGDRW